MQIKNEMKNRINTDQFHVKTGFLGNGRRNGIPQIQKRTEKIENGTGRNGNISVPFQQLRGAPVPIDAGTVKSTPRSARQQQHTDSGQ